MDYSVGEELFLAEWNLPLWPPPDPDIPLVRKLVVRQIDERWTEFGYSANEYACAKRNEGLSGVGKTPEEAVDSLIKTAIRKARESMRPVEDYLAQKSAHIASLNSLDRSNYRIVQAEELRRPHEKTL